MRITKGLVIGLVAALLAGAAEAIGETAVRSATTDTAPGGPLTVPIGSIGDRFAYARHERVSPAADWTRDGGAHYAVTTIAQQRDSTGMVHHVVLLEQNLTDGSSAVAVDLATRDVLGAWLDYDVVRPVVSGLENQDRMAQYTYGPSAADADLFGPGVYVQSPLMIHQGRTYRVGDAVDDVPRQLLANEALHIDMNWGKVELTNVEVDSRVAQRGIVAGTDAMDLRTTGCVSLAVGDPDNVWWWGDLPEVEFLGFFAPVPSRVCFTVDEWVPATMPYPVLTQVRVVIGDATTFESATSLASFVPGSSPIPWGVDSAPEHYRSSNPDAERSPSSQRYPADGTATALSFPLGSALQAVAADPTLVGYVAWRATHADALLVGANMAPTGAQGTGRLWALTFAVPAGSAFVIQSEQAAPGGPAVQSEVGEFTVDSFEAGEVGAGPITFGALESMWKAAFAPPSDEVVPNSAGWGRFQYYPGGVRCPAPSDCEPWAAGFYADTAFDTMFLASRSAPTNRGRAIVIAEYERLPDLMIWTSSATGNLGGHREFQRQARVDPLAIPAGFETPDPATAAFPAAASPDLGRAALLSTSLAALVLLAYFFPALKFLAAKAALAIPGYAKIAKADVLNNRLREQVAQAVRAEPGLSPTQLQERLGGNWSTMAYHLRVLEKNGVVSSLVDGRHKRFFPREDVRWGDRNRLAALQNARTRELYELLLEMPGQIAGDLAARTGISRPAIYWHVERLQRAGLVGRDRDGFRVRYFANPTPAQPYDERDAREVA